MPRRRKTIEEAAQRRIEGIEGKGTVWEERSKAADSAYREAFGPILNKQNACALEVERKGLRGYDALVAYAQCMKTKGAGA